MEAVTEEVESELVLKLTARFQKSYLQFHVEAPSQSEEQTCGRHQPAPLHHTVYIYSVNDAI